MEWDRERFGASEWQAAGGRRPGHPVQAADPIAVCGVDYTVDRKRTLIGSALGVITTAVVRHVGDKALRDEPKSKQEIDEEAFVHGQLLAALPGGASLISHLQGYVPEFGDAIMQEICLSTGGTSSVQFWLGASSSRTSNVMGISGPSR